MLELKSNSRYIVRGGELNFQAIGGVEPYTFSMLEDTTDNGSIDSDGVYTAGTAFGRDTIVVTDGNSDTAQLEVVVMNHFELVAAIINKEMNLGPDQVYIYNQKFIIPKDEKIYISIGILNTKPFSNINRHNNGESEQSATFITALDINILSTSPEILSRKEEVILALNSDYSKRMQTLNSFHISPLSSQFTNVSSVEGPSIPFRFNINVNMTYAISRKTNVDCYEEFLGDFTIIT